MAAPNAAMSFRNGLWSVSKVFLLGVFLLLSGDPLKVSGERGKQPPQEKETAASVKLLHQETGEASWYGPGFHGKETASGEPFDQSKMTAASPNLALGTKAEVTNLKTGKKVEVKITDRGPYTKSRAIDVSHAAAKKLGIVKKGTAPVKIEVKSKRKKTSRNKHKKGKRGSP